ncbi:hypothetical protein CAEBREN_16468 [Caenorhabditis brenneri]|uniref:Uncharacterized protein n=1 Tax=Caenorhabditis brenneri TaxID=135651 RepID=G0P1M1_CAEBE|nr:hypothetical protein CAEBREN_16468 [Caenorhabditis brenneri]
MSRSYEELIELGKSLAAMQKELEESAKASIDKTLKDAPTAAKAQDLFMTIEDYIQEYGVLLKGEHEHFVSEYNKYSEIYKNVLERLFETPSGNILSNTIKEALEQIIEKDNSIKRQIELLEKRLNFRLDGLNKLAETENVQGLHSETYQIVPEWKPMSLTTETIKPKQKTRASVFNETTTQPNKASIHHRHINLPYFYGDLAEWPAFYMIFKATVIDNNDFAPVEKHNILRNQLKGAAADIIRPYAPDGTQFNVTMERLIAIYNSPEKQYDYHWDRLMNVPKAKETAHSLRVLHNELSAILSSLKAYEEIESQNFQSIIRKKIPRSILIDILKSKPTNTTELLNALDAVTSIEEAAQRSETLEKQDKSVFTVKKAQPQTQQKTCKFCNRKNHSTVECKTVRTLEDRKEFIKNNNLCFNCMNSGHRLHDCKSNACRKCNTKHNTAICPKNQNIERKSEYPRNKESSAPQFNRNQNTNYQKNNFSKPSYTSNQNTDQRFNQRNSRPINTNWKPNQGTYSPQQQQQKTAQNRNENHRNQDNNSIIKVEALTVPDITDLFDPIALSHEDRDYLEKRNEKTANITRTEKVVALIGCDVFWEIVANPGTKLPSGRIIIPTQIGNVICGRNEKSATNTHALIARIKRTKEEEVSETNLEEFMEVSNIGITESSHEPSEKEIIDHFKNTVKINKNTNRVVVTFPWKEGQREKLGNNKEVAYCRLRQQYFAARDKEAWTKLKENFASMEQNDEGFRNMENVIIMRFKRLPFGVNCSPFLLSMALVHGIQQSDAPKELVEAVEQMCYVDNFFITTDDINKLPEYYTSLKHYFNQMGMNMREFSVNSCDDFIRPEDKVKNTDNIKVLGYLYDSKNDTYEVRKPEISIRDENTPIRKMTKRKLVGEITTIFDPLQIFAPLYYDGKIILRDVSDHQIKWNDVVEKDLAIKTLNYKQKIATSTLKFRRNTESNGNIPIQIAIFTDAAEAIYGTCLYLKIPIQERPGQFEIHLLIAKQRIAPKIKTLTIPRLELMGILIGVRLLKYTLSEMNLNPSKIEIFSDSTIALAQIKNQSTIKSEKQPVWVERRCNEIWMTLQNIKEGNPRVEISLSHVPTDQNPADHITRGSESEEELKKTNYFYGPEWLSDNDHPDHPLKKDNNNKIEVPIPEDNIVITPNVLVTKTKKLEENTTIPLEKINNFDKAVRATAYALRFLKHRFYDKVSDDTKEKAKLNLPELAKIKKKISGQLELEELQQAEKLLIRNNQISFEIRENPKENQFLSKEDPSDHIVYQYNRIPNCDKKPIIKTNSELARQIIQKIHKEHLHAGPAATLGFVLDKYAGKKWKAAVKRELKRCSVCRKANNHSFRDAPPGDLPIRRTTPCRPFQHIGVDFLGPIKTQVRNSSEILKSHILLITCATTRLIHLELVRDLSTDEFLMALSRFMNRRGCPETITSDNASTFTLASEILDRYAHEEDEFFANLDFEQIDNFREKDAKSKTNILEKEMSKKRIKWYFNTALAPWQGGFYERLVGIVKKALKHALGDSLYKTTNLETLITECESMINRRPITYIDEDSEDCKVLRPIDFYCAGLLFPQINDKGLDDDYVAYTSQYREIREQAKRFWHIFYRDYLQQNKNFRSIAQHNRAFSNLVKPVLGEVVLLKDEKTDRKNWKLGIITELITGRDGEIRSVRVRTTQKKKHLNGTRQYQRVKNIEITRPLKLVIPLEIRPQTSEKSKPEEIEDKSNQEEIEEENGKNVNAVSTQQIQNKKIKKTPSRPAIRRAPTYIWKYYSMYMMIFMCLLALMSGTSAKPDSLGSFNFPNRTIPDTEVYTSSIPSIPQTFATTTTVSPTTTKRKPKVTTTPITTTEIPTTTTQTTTRKRTPSPTTTTEVSKTTTTEAPTTTVRTSTQRSTPLPTTTRSTTVPTTTTEVQTQAPTTKTTTTRSPNRLENARFETRSSQAEAQQLPSPIVLPPADTAENDLLNDLNPTLQKEVEGNFPKEEGVKRAATMAREIETTTIITEETTTTTTSSEATTTPNENFHLPHDIPTTDEKFQIYTCESWSNAVSFQTTLTLDNKETDNVFVLSEGDDYQIKFVYGDTHEIINIKIRLLEVTGETGLSILGKTFIQNKEKVAIAANFNDNFPLECTEDGACNYRETCRCTTTEEEAQCICDAPDLYKMIDDHVYNLPVITERYHLGTNLDNVPTLRMKHNKLHVQIVMKQNYNTSVIESKIDCSVTKTTPYSGCYNCIKGANQNVTCQSKEPTHAKLSCDNGDFVDILTCDKKGIVNEIHRKFNVSSPKGVCTVVCGNKNNSYKIEGTLTYVSKTSLFEYLNQVFHSEKKVISTINHQFNIMSKRPHMSIAEKVNERAEEMAVTWQLRAITERAAREMRRPQRPPPRCRFCAAAHQTAECTAIPQGEKMDQAARKRICLICLTHAGHHPANCRGLRTPINLCSRRCCGNNYIIHHKTICESASPAASPQQSPRNDDDNQNHQK